MTAVISFDLFRDPGFGYSYRQNLNGRSPNVAHLLQSLSQSFVQRVKQSDVHFLQCLSTAKLIDFMVYFIKYPCLIVLNGVVFYGGIDQFFFQSIDHFNLACVKWGALQQQQQQEQQQRIINRRVTSQE